jgi:hypothetical protein
MGWMTEGQEFEPRKGQEFILLHVAQASSGAHSYLEEKVAASVYKIKNTAVGIRCADHTTPSICKS